jgi:hypothetical protein
LRAEASAKKKADYGSKSAKEDLKAIALLRAHIRAQVDDTVARIKQRMEAGDLFSASQLIKDNAMSMGNMARFKDAVEPIKAKLTTPDAKREILLGKSYFSLMDRLKKRRSRTYMQQLEKLANRNKASLYGKAAQAAYDDLQDSDAEVDADKYLGIK